MNSLNTHSNWVDAVATLQAQGVDLVLVTLLGARGSTPRDNGTKMVVSAEASYGTIGGGHMELKATQVAADMLGKEDDQRIEYFPLGPALGQCCGGSATVLFESFRGSRFNVAVFGAGHVGQALTGILQQLPCRLHWVDGRDAFEPRSSAANVINVPSDDPAAEVAMMPPGSDYLIMTHNHQLDYEILEGILKRGDARYIGLIGSETKWRRFRMRLEHRGFSPQEYALVRCPVGLAEVPGKRPIEVAVSIAGELIALNNASEGTRANNRGVSLRDASQAIEQLSAGAVGKEESTV